MATRKRNPTSEPETRTYAARQAAGGKQIVSFTLAPETMKSLRAFSEASGVSMSAVVALSVAEYVKRHGSRDRHESTTRLLTALGEHSISQVTIGRIPEGATAMRSTSPTKRPHDYFAHGSTKSMSIDAETYMNAAEDGARVDDSDYPFVPRC